jgi:hypothetical protein
MNAPQRFDVVHNLRGVLLGAGAPCARLVVSWACAGGIAAGGILVGGAALRSPAMAQPLLSLAPVLFLLGATGGVILGALLAWGGRPSGVDLQTARSAIACGVALSIPALAAAWVATAWISLTSAVLTLHGAATVAVAAVGWVVGLWVCMWATWEGGLALRAALQRVRDRVRVRTTPAW